MFMPFFMALFSIAAFCSDEVLNVTLFVLEIKSPPFTHHLLSNIHLPEAVLLTTLLCTHSWYCNHIA